MKGGAYQYNLKAKYFITKIINCEKKITVLLFAIFGIYTKLCGKRWHRELLGPLWVLTVECRTPPTCLHWGPTYLPTHLYPISQFVTLVLRPCTIFSICCRVFGVLYQICPLFALFLGHHAIFSYFVRWLGPQKH